MAALYLHHALFSPDVSESSSRDPHSRNISTGSAAFLTGSLENSQPTDPLLKLTEAPTRYHLVPQRGVQPFPVEPWERTLTLEGDPVTPFEKKGRWETGIRTKLKRLQWIKLGLEALIAAWAIFNSTMYFLAFTMYESPKGRIVSLVLGIITCISFTFLAGAHILSLIQPRLVCRRVKIRFLVSIRMAFLHFCTLSLLAPTIANMVFVFLWRRSHDVELRYDHRCRPDIDVAWSVSTTLCSKRSPDWGIWLAVASVRLFLTSGILVFYHFVLILHQHTLRTSKLHPSLSSSRSARLKHLHHRSESYHSSLPPMAALSTTTVTIPELHQRSGPTMSREVSESTLASTSKLSTARHSASQYSSPQPSDSNITSNFYGSPPALEAAYTKKEEPIAGSSATQTDLDQDFDSFVGQLQSLATQVAKETEEGLQFARPISPSVISDRHLPAHSEHGYISSDEYGDNDSDTTEENYQLPPPPPPVLGYNEFGLPYAPEENVRMLNGYVRRMPTIESMGSRELEGTSASTSLRSRDHERAGSSVNGSRSPTRNTLLSWGDGSEPPSRSNSLTARAELMVGYHPASPGTPTGVVSEMGEIMQGDPIVSASTMASRSTGLSYFTATAGSKSSNSSSSFADGSFTADNGKLA